MRLRPAGAVAVLAAALVAVSLAPAQAEDLDQRQKTVKQRLAAAESDIETLSQQAAVAAAALQAAREQLPLAQAEVASAAADLSAARAKDAALAVQLAAAVANEGRTEAETIAVEDRVQSTQRLLGLLARRAYQNGQLAELAVVLDAESVEDFAGRLSGLQSVADSQVGLMGRLAIDTADLAAKKYQLAAVRAQVEEQRAAAAAQVVVVTAAVARATAAQASVERLVAARSRALRAVEAARAGELARVAVLKAEQRKVAALIAAAASRGSGQVGGGELAWPVPAGGLTQRSGPRIHPVYGYKSCHTGIDIGGGYGATIVAAAAGVVVSTEASSVYGNVTIVDHGDGLSTFYAHQSGRSVGQGQRVTRGQPIGQVGSTGWSTGPHLHFEVHVNGVPYDPLGWLGLGSKRPIVC